MNNNLWLEIFTKYSEPKRHYHTISHLEKIVIDLVTVKTEIQDWDTTLFAVYYHDIIYKATSSTNEEDSAKLAKERLTQIGYPEDKILKCMDMIMATKNHNETSDNDTNFFTDADLAILGQSQQDYYDYTENIRKEYTIFPDFMYNSGRKKVLQHLLQMEKIFKTDFFYNRYEKQARINLNNELEALES